MARHSAGVRAAILSFQEVAEAEEAVTNVVKTTDFGEVRKGTFSITVKSDEKDEKGKDKILYENKSEAFEYDVVNSLSNALKHLGAKLTDDQINFVGEALTSTDAETDKTIGEAVAGLVKTYNAKLKSDAKSARYQALVNQYKPLEGEKLETAQARTIANVIKMSGLPKDAVIKMLVENKVLPNDYTVADFDSTPLRRTKGDSDE